MPNWVFNGLTIEGNPEQVKNLIKQMNKPFIYSITAVGDLSYDVKQTKYVNPIFAFHNIYNYRDAGITDEVYHGQPPRSTDFAEAMKFETNDWYNFNVREWGTKWDVAVDNKSDYSNTIKTVNDDGSIMYHFETAWSPVGEVLIKLSEMYPTLNFDYEYEEETGWGGACTFLGGEDIACDEYESPMSHADYKDRDKECVCEYGDPESGYEDCPVDTTKFNWNKDEEEWQEITIDSASQVR